MTAPYDDGMTMPLPAKDAPFSEKMAYYRSQHSTRGIRATHLVGIPGVAFSLPVLLTRSRRKGLFLFVLSWVVQVFGHKYYEKNNPSLTKGFVTYQLCGLAFWCEEVADLVAGRGLGGADRPGEQPPAAGTERFAAAD